MFYNDEIESVMNEWRSKTISKEVTIKKLSEIEEKAYRLIPDAEPDGDITYATACAVAEIFGM